MMRLSVFATGFSDDFTSASSRFETRHAGVFDRDELLALLEQIQSVSIPSDEQDIVPHLLVQGVARNSVVSVCGGALHLSSGHGEDGLGEAITAAEICARLADEKPRVAASTRKRKRVVPARLLVWMMGAAISVCAVIQISRMYSGYYSFKVPFRYTPITDSEVLAPLVDGYTGLFWTTNNCERTVLALDGDGESWLYAASKWRDAGDFILLESADYEFAYVDGVPAIVLDEYEPVLIENGVLVFDGEPLAPAAVTGRLAQVLLQGGEK